MIQCKRHTQNKEEPFPVRPFGERRTGYRRSLGVIVAIPSRITRQIVL
jgi:hypothetical protein